VTGIGIVIILLLAGILFRLGQLVAATRAAATAAREVADLLQKPLPEDL
jgi:Flp pilus assembly protein TadG